jgi:hypothetical protein
MRVGNILIRQGCKRKQVRVNGVRQWMYFLPEDLLKEEKKEEEEKERSQANSPKSRSST